MAWILHTYIIVVEVEHGAMHTNTSLQYQTSSQKVY
jgi:hypothetical protein